MVRLFRTCSLALVLSAASVASAEVASLPANPTDVNASDHPRLSPRRMGHGGNNGITFRVTTAALPEPSAIILLGGGILGLFFRHRALNRRQAELDAQP
jgi:hypothetical protein